jgi:hypothetical protein
MSSSEPTPRLAQRGVTSDGKKVLVVARDYRCFGFWCFKQGLSKRDPLLKYIRDDQDLHGCDPKTTKLVAVCDWWDPHVRQFREVENLRALISHLRKLGMEVRSDTCY